ncbi:uncharacterized protein LOC110984373 [Acanthaster planci]|uniref:Uncharacterized protein LOC110984373 n=1 Tax=Acanthaster planci TaxID=133434 RepID=A0A8B7Z3J9_ACAPL|nr:uncharacterized protein LOC110984373 [Acanthaster planci]
MPLDQQTSNAKKDVTKKGCDANSSSDKDKWPSSTSSSETKELHCNPRASARGAGCNSSTLKPSDNSTSKRISQTKDLPLNSGTSYSYVAWRDQNAKRAMDAVKKSDPAASTETAHNRTFSSADSKSGRQSDAESVQNPGDRPTKVNVSQHTCEEPRLKSEAVTSEVPSESTFSTRGLGNKKSQCPSSGRHPEPTPDTASTHSQDSGLNFRSAPKDDRNRDGFSRTRGSSNEVPSAEPDVRAKESSKPRPMESKTRPDSGVAANSHPHQQRRAEGSTSRASQPGRPASDSASKSSRPGTAQGPRQQSSTRASAARAAPCAREDDAGTRPKDRKREGTSPAGATTDNIDIEDVDPWYKWTRAIGRGLWWALCFAVFLLLILLACLYSTLKVGIKYSWHILRELVKLLQENWHSGRAYQGTSGGQGSRGSSSHGNRSRAPAEPTRSIDIPTSGGEAIKRLLRCNRDNPYEVLGVSSEASEDDIKKYYRRQCMLVHPDKNDLPAASEAFQILQKAYETLTDPVKRREFEMESQHAHFDEEMEDLMKKMEEKMEEVLNTLSCDVCGGKHRRYETNRDPYSARYCSRHGFRHPAHEGDVWVETSHLGFKWHFYAMMEDKIFDITEWAVCQDMKYMEPNSCEVRYRVGTQRSRSAPRQRAPPPGAHGFTNHHSHHRGQEFNDDMAEEMLKEFLRQFHQGDPRGGRAGGPSYGGGDAGSQERGKKHKKHRKKKR